jgi:hypothetical protein
LAGAHRPVQLPRPLIRRRDRHQIEHVHTDRPSASQGSESHGARTPNRRFQPGTSSVLSSSGTLLARARKLPETGSIAGDDPRCLTFKPRTCVRAPDIRGARLSDNVGRRPWCHIRRATWAVNITASGENVGPHRGQSGRGSSFLPAGAAHLASARGRQRRTGAKRARPASGNARAGIIDTRAAAFEDAVRPHAGGKEDPLPLCPPPPECTERAPPPNETGRRDRCWSTGCAPIRRAGA